METCKLPCDLLTDAVSDLLPLSMPQLPLLREGGRNKSSYPTGGFLDPMSGYRKRLSLLPGLEQVFGELAEKPVTKAHI